MEPVLPKPSDHWMTIMTCIICEETPNVSPLYKCPMSHYICSSCFQELANNGSVRCRLCKSFNFKQWHVSEDFLRKLRTRPGIGRPRRYRMEHVNRSVESKESINIEPNEEETMTIEKLFQLPTEQIEDLFESTAKIRRKNRPSVRREKVQYQIFRNDFSSPRNDVDVKHDRSRRTSCTSLSKGDCLNSRKPVVCPLDKCEKSVAILSFTQHFDREHNNIPLFKAERGKEIYLTPNVHEIEFGRTFCMARIEIYDVLKGSYELVDTFWVLVSGSPEEHKWEAYVLFWLLKNSNENFNCTLEISSYTEDVRYSTFCAVNGILDANNIFDVAYGLNCLNLSYGSMINLLSDGPILHLSVVIH